MGGLNQSRVLALGHFQVGSYGYRSLIEGLYNLQKPYRSHIYPKLPTCSFLCFGVHYTETIGRNSEIVLVLM